jgi:hypothetical protein
MILFIVSFPPPPHRCDRHRSSRHHLRDRHRFTRHHLRDRHRLTRGHLCYRYRLTSGVTRILTVVGRGGAEYLAPCLRHYGLLGIIYVTDIILRGNHPRCNQPFELILGPHGGLDGTSKTLRGFLPMGL